jgi:putative transposase
MDCVWCQSAAVTERAEVTARSYRRFRCWDSGRQINERSGGVLNRTSLPGSVIPRAIGRFEGPWVPHLGLAG